MKKPIQSEVDKTLNALDDIKRATAPPDFYAKLRPKLGQSENTPRIGRSWRFSPNMAIAAVILLLLVNGAVLANEFISNSSADGTDAIIEMYELNSSSYELF